MRAVIVCGLLVACGDNIVPAIDASQQFVCEETAATGTHELFVEFDGLQLIDAGKSNALYDQAAFVDNGVATIPAWRAGDPNRDALTKEITCRLRESLFAYDVLVTRRRPIGNDDYEMIVFGGTAADLGKPSNVGSLVDSDCQNTNTRDVAWVAEYFSDPAQATTIEAAVATAAAMFGAGNGLVPSSDPTNCTCPAGLGTGCDVARACAFTPAANVRANDDFCQTGKTVQDQAGVLLERYGARF